MNPLPRTELRALLNRSAEPSVSLFLPMHRPPAQVQEDRLHFNNALRETGQRLRARGLRTSGVRELLAPGRRLLGDREFWQHRSEGLAAFIGPDLFRFYRLPLRFEELVVVGQRFHLSPLLPLFADEGRFYLLALGENEARLLEGTRHALGKTDLARIPGNLAAVPYKDPEKALCLQVPNPHPGGPHAAKSDGHDAGGEAGYRLLGYFRQIDLGLRNFLRKETAPLVLAGLESCFPIYRKANTYPGLVSGGVPGNPEALRRDELHRRAWAVLEPYLCRAREQAAEQYRRRSHTGRTSHDLREILPAAHQGRVECLFVTAGTRPWGRFDPAGKLVEFHGSPGPDSEDLLDLAALHTLAGGGTVYAGEQGGLPDTAPVAAVFRS